MVEDFSPGQEEREKMEREKLERERTRWREGENDSEKRIFLDKD